QASMTLSRRQLPEAELAVLKILWDAGPATARGIGEAMYPQCGESEIGAVHSLLKRLERKRLVARDRSGHVHQFSAEVSRTAFAGRELEATAEKLSDGSLAPLIVHLVENRRFSETEIDELRRLLDGYARPAKPKQGRSS
ncbi:MAG: BlaI/MecI/CopY family transcriptional regulator, partial [Planctomycetes bacterium]|nr:BlaI/MecI/CopY family transcriptional regulator [Planctomycetota bacterium]